jgi:hypothetical protein
LFSLKKEKNFFEIGKSAYNLPRPLKQSVVISPKWTLKAGAKPAGGWEALGAAAVAAVRVMRRAQLLPPKARC